MLGAMAHSYTFKWTLASFGLGRRRHVAWLTSSASDSASIFRITLPRSAFTVISLMPNSEAGGVPYTLFARNGKGPMILVGCGP